MPQYDGSIRIDTEINTKGFEEGRKELEADTRRAAKSINASIKEMQKEFDTLDRSIEKTAQTITSLTIEANRIRDLHIPTKEYSDAQKEVDKYSIALQKAKEKIDKLLETGVSKESSRFISAQYDVANLENKLLDAEEIVKRLEQEGKAFTIGSDTEEFTNISNQIEDLAQKMHDKQQKQLQLQSDIEAKRLEEIRAEAAEEERLGQIRANAVATNDEIIAKVERIKQLEQEIADLKKVERTEGYADYDNRIAELSKLKQEVKEYSNSLSEVPERFSQMHSAAQKAFDAIRSGLSKIGSIGKKAFSGIFSMAQKAFDAITSGSKQSNASLSGSLKTILKYGLGIRSLYALFSKIRSGIKTGFTNFMGYSDSFANSVQEMKNALATLGNQFAAAFAPIVQAVIPWLTKLINVLSTAMTYVAQFIAILGGKSTFTRAKQVQDSYNKSLGGTAAAAKKAYGALAKFDDLDVLQKQEDNAVGVADAITGDLFEEVPIKGNILNIAEKIKDILSKLFDPLKEAWDRVGEKVIKAWKYALDEVGKLIKDIGRDFLEVWQEEATVKILENILHIIKDIGLVIGNLARNFREAWNENKVGLSILSNIRDIIGIIVQHIKNAADATVGWSNNLDFYPLLDAFNRFLESLKPAVDAISGILEDFYTKVLLPLGEWVLEKGLPELLQVFIDFNNKVDWESLRANLTEFWEHLEPFAETVGEGLIIFIGRVSDALANFLNSQEFKDFLVTIENWMDSVTPEDVANGLELITKGLIALKLAVLGFSAISAITGVLTTLKTFFSFFSVGGGAAEASGAMLGTAEAVSGLSVAISGLTTALAVVAAAVAGWHIGSWIAEKLELDPQPFNETMQGIKDSFTDGSWKDALQLWGDDIYNAFVTLGERQAEWWESVKTTWSNAWENIKETVSNILTSIKDNITNKFNEIKLGFTNFKTNVSTIWTNLWDGFKTKVSNIVENVKETLTTFFSWVQGMISSILNAISGIGAKISGLSGGVGGSLVGAIGGGISTTATYSTQSFASLTADLPHLASGSVIRGGNPFMAVLGDQRVGQTNIEAPLSTIEQAVDNVLSRRGYGAQVGGSFNPVIALNVNGEEFARLTLNDIFQEAARQGYDVSILGVT